MWVEIAFNLDLRSPSVPRTTKLFFLESRIQITLDLISHLSQENKNARIVVVDISTYSIPKLAPWAGRLPRGYWSASKFFEDAGIEYIDGSKMRPSIIDYSIEEKAQIETAVRSSVISCYARGVRVRETGSLIERRLAKRLHNEAQKVFSLALDLIKSLDATEVFVTNERFGPKYSPFLAAQRAGIRTLFYTYSADELGTFRLSEFMTHDRTLSQEHALRVTADLSGDKLQALVDKWFNRTENTFGQLWDESGKSWTGPRASLALFATSSADETESLNLNWREASWTSQYAAFEAVWSRLKVNGLTPVLRVHPNLLNKSPASAYRELRTVRQFLARNPDFLIIWPASRVSTYELLSCSEVVVVENSTVGAEASAHGIPVICTNSCYYDLIADVTKVHGPKDLVKVDTLSHSPDPLGARRYLAYEADLRDERLSQRARQGLRLSKISIHKLIIPSLLDGSLLSALLEVRWKLFRFILVVTTPKS